MIADTAGVERSVFWPTQTLFTPLAAAILMMICNNTETGYSQAATSMPLQFPFQIYQHTGEAWH